MCPDVGVLPDPQNTRFWAEIEAMLRPVAERGGHDWSEVIDKLAADHAQMWIVWDGSLIAALVTAVTSDGVCVAWLAGGREHRSWARVADRVIPKAAKELGCSRVRIWGRPGWKRVFPHWREVERDGDLVVLEREIGDEE